MNNPPEAWLVLGLTIAGAVVIGIVALTICRRIKYPKGLRIDVPNGCYGKTTLVVSRELVAKLANGAKVEERLVVDGNPYREPITKPVEPGRTASPRELAEACAKAIRVAGAAWKEYDGKCRWDPCEELRDFCFNYVADAEYEEAWEKTAWPTLKGSSGVRGQLKRGVGSGPLSALIRGSLVEHSIATGSPAVHEAVHGLDKWNSFHVNPPPPIRDGKVWREKGVPDEETVEGRAYAKFKEGAL